MLIEIWKKRLEEDFSKFGKILSLCLKIDEKLVKPFAFICFEKAEEAEQAYNYYKQKLLEDD